MNSSILATFGLLVCVGLVVVLMLATSIRILPEYRRLVTFRLGRVTGVAGPGIVFVVPFVDRGVAVDLREQLIETNGASAVTQDNSPVTFDLACRYKVTDPVRSLTEVQDGRAALGQAALSAAREVIAAQSLYDFLQDQGAIRPAVEARLRQVAMPWGMEIAGVELHNLKRTA